MKYPQELINTHPGLGDWSILHCYRGSIAHGMYTGRKPDSIDDRDTISICIPTMDYYLGLKEFGTRGTQEIMQPVNRVVWDTVIYECRKAVFLLSQGNPNVLSLLWTDPKYFISIEPEGKMLLEKRDLFVGKHVFKPFVGYAMAQKHKMTHNAYEGYMGAKRKALVDKFGYDCKNAAHYIRLLRMGIEFLTSGELQVERGSDATVLLDIKNGLWTMEQVEAEGNRLTNLIELAMIESKLPDYPDKEAINRLCTEMVGNAIGVLV